MFNLPNGEIYIDDVKISPKTIKSYFASSKLKDKIIEEKNIPKDDGTYTRYELGKQKIDGEFFFTTIIFDNELIYTIHISLAMIKENLSWNSWSEENETLRNELNNKWLFKHLGNPPYKYDWGEIASNFDTKAGFSYIAIKYF